ncbi:MAG: methyltransferase dimerization domain-containing protein, partial [Pseudomonadota bacterium]
MSFRDRLLGWRDRLVADPGFHRFASRFWLTRPIVRREAGALFDLTAGFVYSQILSACVRLDLFDQLKDGPRSCDWLADHAGLASTEMHRLLEAAAALRLLGRRSGNRWGLGQLGAAVIGTPGLSEMIRHHSLLYKDMEDPVGLLRSQGRDAVLGAYWTYAQSGSSHSLSVSDVTEYSALMAASQRMLSDDILDTIRIDRFESLLDVGGGEGAFILRAAERSSSVRLGMFD